LYTALSVLPADDHNYIQSPYEEITEKEYNKLVKSLRNVDLSKVIEDEDETTLQDNLACGGGGCEL
jgi:ribonucleoside-diphosphate reductase alpha chain